MYIEIDLDKIGLVSTVGSKIQSNSIKKFGFQFFSIFDLFSTRIFIIQLCYSPFTLDWIGCEYPIIQI